MLENQFGRLKALQPAARKNRVATRGMTPELPPESARLADLLAASVERNRYGECLALRRWFSEPAPAVPQLEVLRLLAPSAPEMAADRSQWLFLDTETTGLAGGTGTYAFLVGLAWWDAGGLEVEQIFMRDHSEEHSLLVALEERLAERRVLITFNGKTFDWPLLETRFRMTRAITPRAPRAHLDLLHPSRQLWRLQLGSVRLAELERHVLGWNRGPDVMTELIPQIYFDFLRGGAAEPLVPVFHHNQMDLRGVAALARKIFDLLAEPEPAESDALELYGMSRMAQRRGEPRRARQLYERALEQGLPAAVDLAARLELARLAKRERDFRLANRLWEDLRSHSTGATRSAVEACVELAIYHEHRGHEPERAATLAREAISELGRGFHSGQIEPRRYRRTLAQLEHRLERLSRKAASRPLLGRVRHEACAPPSASKRET